MLGEFVQFLELCVIAGELKRGATLSQAKNRTYEVIPNGRHSP